MLSGITTSWGLSATGWSGSTRGPPSLSVSYPRERSICMSACMLLGLKWVRGAFVTSIARRSVLVDVDFVLATQSSFLDWFGVLRTA